MVFAFFCLDSLSCVALLPMLYICLLSCVALLTLSAAMPPQFNARAQKFCGRRGKAVADEEGMPCACVHESWRWSCVQSTAVPQQHVHGSYLL